MKPVYYLFIACFLLPFSDGIRAQEQLLTSEYAYRHYTTDDGLPQMILTSVYQDSKGFIWVGSKAGLSRYDGFGFKNFAANSDGIFRIFEDKNGDVQGLDYSTLYVIDQKSDSIERTKLSTDYELEKYTSQSLPAPYAVFSHYPENNKCTTALFAINNRKLNRIFTHDSLCADINFSNKIHWDINNHRFYIPNISGVSIVNENGALDAYWGAHIYILCFVETPSGELMAVGRRGIYRIAGLRYELLCPHDFGREDMVQAFPYEGGLIIKGNNSIYRYTPDNNRVKTIFTLNVPINQLLIDNEKNIWVATHKGLYNFFGLNFKNVAFPNDADIIRSAVIDRNETLWIGTFGGKVYSRSKDGTVRRHVYPDWQGKYNIARFFHAASSYDAGRNRILFPGCNGVLEIENGNIRWLNVPPRNYNNTILLTDGKYLIGTSYGFWVYDRNGKLIDTVEKNRYKLSWIYDVRQDRRGRYWVTGKEGVTIVDKLQSKILTSSAIASCAAIESDADGSIWFASENRLLKAEQDTATLIHTFPANITNLFSYDKNRLIVCSTKGFYNFNPQTRQCVYFDFQNGFTGLQPESTPIFTDPQGNVWINSLKYLVQFDIRSVFQRPQKPNLQITDILTSRDNVYWKSRDIRQLHFTHRCKNMRIKYIGLLYSAASNVRYQYRLIGFQNEWSNPVSEREATFNNLPPGHYTFELKCNAGTPETQTKTLSLPIYIKPAFWQTWLFRILLFILFVTFISLLTYNYLKKKHIREIRKTHREKEMNELRIQSVRLKSIPHFNSNVLAGIEYFIMTKSKEEANHLLTTYSRFTNITLHEIDKAQRPLADELDYVKMYLDLEKMRYGNKLNYEISVNETVNTSIMIPNMVLHTFAENAVKHGIRGKNSAGKVQIGVTNEKKGICLSVEDDGVGRTESAKRNAEQNRTGHGLAILSRQIELYNQQNNEKIEQRITDLSNGNGVSCGTRFEMYVPYEFRYI